MEWSVIVLPSAVGGGRGRLREGCGIESRRSISSRGVLLG